MFAVCTSFHALFVNITFYTRMNIDLRNKWFLLTFCDLQIHKYPALYATLADESTGKIPIILSVVMGCKHVITR